MNVRPRIHALVAAAAVAALAPAGSGCGGDGGGNPPRLYLALLDSELTVQLVPGEPSPY